MIKIYCVLLTGLLFLLTTTGSFSQKLVFAERAGSDSQGSTGDEGNSIAIDQEGNIYTTGTMLSGSGGAVFGEGQPNETVLNINGAFIAKYTGSGELLWVQQAGASNNGITGYGITVDKNNNVYVSGTFYQQATFGAGQEHETTLSGIYSEIFIAKYSSDGQLVWAKSAGGENDDNPGGTGLAVDEQANVYLTGAFWGSAIFGAGETNETILNGENLDVFVAKYDTDGQLLWVKKAGGPQFDGAKNIDLDENGNLYLTGNYYNEITFEQGASNEKTIHGSNESSFIAKYNEAGDFQWAMAPFSAHTADISGDVTVDEKGDVVFTGSFFGTITFGEGTDNETQLTGAGLDEIVLAKYTSEGKFLWARTANGKGDDRGLSVTTDTLANIFITGYFEESIQFGVGERNDTTIVNAGTSDIFVAKFAPDGEFIWVTSAGGSEWEQT